MQTADSQLVVGRFFDALYRLKADKVIRGKQTFTSRYGINRWNMNKLEKEKEDELLRQEARASEEKLQLQEKLLQEEKASGRQASVLQILSKEYSSVYYVDLEEDTVVPLRVSDVFFEIYGVGADHSDSFRRVYESYIRSFTANTTSRLMPRANSNSFTSPG